MSLVAWTAASWLASLDTEDGAPLVASLIARRLVPEGATEELAVLKKLWHDGKLDAVRERLDKDALMDEMTEAIGQRLKQQTEKSYQH